MAEADVEINEVKGDDEGSASQTEPETRTFDPDGDVVLVLWETGEDSNSTKKAGQEYHMVVCSKTLGLASKVFHKMLQGSFREAAALKSSGNARVPLPDDDPHALTILLDIVHHRPSRVPRTIEQSLLAEIAYLVDKYCFHEIIGPFSEAWIGNLQSNGVGNHHYTAQMAIYYCFDRLNELGSTVRQAIRGVRTPLDAGHLPVPEKFIRAINEEREYGISTVFGAINDIRAQYQGSNSYCEYRCDCMQLGAFIKELGRLRLHRLPDPPYQNYSLENLATSLRTLRTPACVLSHNIRHIDAKLEAQLNKMENGIDEFTLSTEVADESTGNHMAR